MSIDVESRPAAPVTDGHEELRLKGGGGRRRWIAAGAGALAVAVVAIVLATGGSSGKTVAGSHFGTTLPVAYEADSASERAFLVWLNQSIAPRYGVHIDPVGIQDGNQLDQATATGQFAANIYQHIHWLNEVVKSTGMKLTAVGPVFQWAYSIYSAKHKRLSELPNGAQIALLNDPANTAQALWLLERAGEITFKPGTVPWSATTSDIASNPHNLHFVFIDYGAGPRTLGSVDAVIAYNMQFIAAGTPQSDRIYAPPAPRSFAGQLVVGDRYRTDPQVKKLIRVFFDPRVQSYLRTTTNPKLAEQPIEQQLGNPVWHLLRTNGEREGARDSLPVSYGLLLNLVGVMGPNATREQVWSYLANYIADPDPARHPALDGLVTSALAYSRDFVSPTLQRRKPEAGEAGALAALDKELAAIDANATPELLQNIIYEIGKNPDYGFENLRDWFKALYETLLGSAQGPRMGSFIALYGVANTRALIAEALDFS